MENQNKSRKKTNIIKSFGNSFFHFFRGAFNRVFKRIRAFFCTYDHAQIRQHDEENSTSAPIELPSEPSIISPIITKQIDETTSVVYRETLVKPSLLIPRQYFHDLLTHSNPNHSVLIRRDPDYQRHFCKMK